MRIGISQIIGTVKVVKNLLNPAPCCPKCNSGKKYMVYRWVKDPIYGKIKMWVCEKCGTVVAA